MTGHTPWREIKYRRRRIRVSLRRVWHALRVWAVRPRWSWGDAYDWATWHGSHLPKRIAHWCPNWDDLPIDDTSSEMIACGCRWADSELQAIADSARAIHDATYYENVAPAGDGATGAG